MLISRSKLFNVINFFICQHFKILLKYFVLFFNIIKKEKYNKFSIFVIYFDQILMNRHFQGLNELRSIDERFSVIGMQGNDYKQSFNESLG